MATKSIPVRSGKTASLMVRVDPVSKSRIDRAAALRRLSTSDYVRTVMVAQAEREVREAESRVIALAPAEQEAFWQALQQPVELTAKQRELGRLMRGEA